MFRCIAIIGIGALIWLNASIALLAQEKPQAVYAGALDTECAHVGPIGSAGYQFINTCAGRALSPNGQWAVMHASGGTAVTLTTKDGRLLDDIPALSDDMPFVLYWSLNSRWFFANHYLGSGLERLRVFQVVNRVVIERSSVFAAATEMAVSRYPCLGRTAIIVASGHQWSRDGRRIAMTVYARPDACLVEKASGKWEPDGEWQPLWMIGDAETGKIDPASVRVRNENERTMPRDGPYATF